MLDVTAGTLYTVAVDSFGSATGPFTLNVTLDPPSAPANDNWAAALDISNGFGARSWTNAYSSGEAGEPNHGGVAVPLNSVWYSFSFPTRRVVQIDTCGSSLDSVIAVYTGSSVGALTLVASNDDACGYQSRIIFQAAAGAMYTAVVDGFETEIGPFTLHFAARTLPTHPRPVG